MGVHGLPLLVTYGPPRRAPAHQSAVAVLPLLLYYLQVVLFRSLILLVLVLVRVLLVK